MKKILSWILPLLFCAAFVYGRIICYGPMTDSITAQDTRSYFEAAAEPFPTLEFFELPRSATLPLLIRFCCPTGEADLSHMSEPHFGSKSALAFQAGTETLVKTQNIIAIACWVLLAILAASSVESWLTKALVSFLILAFAFVPQIADWDSILISESLSFSLFALLVGLLLKVIPDGKPCGIGSWIWGLLFFVTAALWVFTRDTNAYFILLTGLLLLITCLVWWFGHAHLNAASLLLSFCLIGLFVFHQVTFRHSERWLLPFMNNMTANVFPNETAVEWFEEEGMPVSEELLANKGSAEYNHIYEQEEFLTWARHHGLDTYQKWLLSTPLGTVLDVWNHLDSFFTENLQPFFYGQPNEKPHWADGIGNLLHPMSSGVILADLLALIITLVRAIREKSGSRSRMLVFTLIMFLGGGLMMSMAYLGEVRSIWRHVLPGVMALRLILWMSLAMITDRETA